MSQRLSKKRSRGEDDDGDDDSPYRGAKKSGEAPSVGQQTSIIKNKQVRAEMYSKLKHKQAVSVSLCCLHLSNGRQ